VLELRIGVETESAALAAARRTTANLAALRAALKAFSEAVQQGRDAVGPDFQIHLEIARATQNVRYADLMATLGGTMIPRARLEKAAPATAERGEYLRRVNVEHESIVHAIERRDPEGARAAMRTHLTNSKDRRERMAGAARPR
jgi:GntR family transcriptional regulator, transcriptional repressor for pyruvate dehydrogenase complex